MTFQAHGGWRSKSFANKDPLDPLWHCTGPLEGLKICSTQVVIQDFASIPAKISGGDCLLTPLPQFQWACCTDSCTSYTYNVFTLLQ